jgi:mono/diheme cytochrome c family protein
VIAGGRARFSVPCAALLLALGLGAAACDDDGTRPNREYMPDMVSSVAYDSFAPNPVTRDGRTLMAPPAGTVPRGYQPLHFAAGPKEAARAAAVLVNAVPDGPAARQRGEVAFRRWCSPCHGPTGQGDGLVARRFPRPPPLTAEHARGLRDGQIFHVMTFGQGVMPGYAQQIAQEDRWMILRFLRTLQAPAAAPIAAAAPPAAPAPPAAGAAAATKKEGTR